MIAEEVTSASESRIVVTGKPSPKIRIPINKIEEKIGIGVYKNKIGDQLAPKKHGIQCWIEATSKGGDRSLRYFHQYLGLMTETDWRREYRRVRDGGFVTSSPKGLLIVHPITPGARGYAKRGRKTLRMYVTPKFQWQIDPGYSAESGI